MARHDVVEREPGDVPAAVLARVAVADEDLASREPDARPRSLDAVLEPDDRGGAQHRARRPDLGVVVLDDLGLLAEDEPERATQVAHVQRLVIRVEEKDDAIHRSPRAGGSAGLAAHRSKGRSVRRPARSPRPPAPRTIGLPGARSVRATRTPPQSPHTAQRVGRAGDGGMTQVIRRVCDIETGSEHAVIQQQSWGHTMNAYCPECETELDQEAGICPACRWDPYLVAPKPTKVAKFEGSISDRYRGTPYDSQWQEMAASHGSGISRGRVFVVTAMLAVAGHLRRHPHGPRRRLTDRATLHRDAAALGRHHVRVSPSQVRMTTRDH